MPSFKSKTSPVVTLKLDAELIRALNDFAEREGFTSTSTAIRALLVGALDAYPSWGVMRSEMLSSVQEVRAWAISEVLNSTKDMMDRFALSLKNPPDKFVRGKPIYKEE